MITVRFFTLSVTEIERLEKGEDNKDRSVAFIDVHSDSPQNVGLKIRIPVQEFPRVRFKVQYFFGCSSEL